MALWKNTEPIMFWLEFESGGPAASVALFDFDLSGNVILHVDGEDVIARHPETAKQAMIGLYSGDDNAPDEIQIKKAWRSRFRPSIFRVQIGDEIVDGKLFWSIVGQNNG